MTDKRIQGKTNTAPPWEPAAVTPAEIQCIQALTRGEATKDQQALFVKWMERATAVGELEFRPSGERESNFAAGKRFVGLQFFTLAKTFLPDPRQG
jgi:hypothetical protein